MDLETICRVCLQGGDMVSLFDCDENNELLSDKYAYCCSVEVSDTDPLPLNICLICVDRLMSAYQFKQQCLSSNDTLRECLREFKKSNLGKAKKGSEIITIKQENGVYLQYEIPVEEDGSGTIQILEGVKRKRGRPRKYPDASGVIPVSPYNRKTSTQTETTDSVLMNMKEEPFDIEAEKTDSSMDEGELELSGDPEYVPGDDPDADGKEKSKLLQEHKAKRRLKKSEVVIKTEADSDRDEEDVLLKETIMANSEPIPEALLNPVKEKKKQPKKKYYYDKIHTCDQCGSSFRSNASLQAHIRRHLGIKPFSCGICGYSCVLNMELRRHMMRHTGVKPYKCRICDRYFGDFGSRQKHERLHLGERPYQCSLCGKSFTYSYVLSNHMLTHTGEKKYECGPCNKKFTKAHHLKYHNKVHHKELYNQEMLMQQAKKSHTMLQSVNIADLTSVCTEQLLGLQNAQIVTNAMEIHQEDENVGHEQSEYVEGHEQAEYAEGQQEEQEYTENEYESQEYDGSGVQYVHKEEPGSGEVEGEEYSAEQQQQHIEYVVQSPTDDTSQEATDDLQVAGDQEMVEGQEDQDIKSIHITYSTVADTDEKPLEF